MEKNLGGSDEAFDVPTDVDICRICQSPEEPNNPLKHPCACRGSLKFVHSDCLFLWINNRKRKHCEICKRSYAIAPVYSKNAPKRLSCLELLMCLLLRALSIIKVIFPWLLVIPVNAYFYFSLIHSDNEDYVEDYGVFISLLSSPAIFYTVTIVSGITLMAAVILTTEVLVRQDPELLHRLEFMENKLRHEDGTGIVLLLFNHFRILSVWWHAQLLKLPFFRWLIERGHLALEFVPRNVQLDQLGVIRRFLFFLDDYTFGVLAINIYWSVTFLLLPFWIGRVVLLLQRYLHHVQIPENVYEVYVGYVVILLTFFTYFISVFPLPRNTRQAIIRYWVVPLSFKDTCILCFKLCVLPWILGCWIDFCAFPITQNMISRKLEVLSDHLVITAKHWYMGQCYLLIALGCVVSLQKMIQKRVFWYLLDVTEPSYKITKLRLGAILFALAFHGAVVVIVFHLPIRTITFFSQSFLPLQIGWVCDVKLVASLLYAHNKVTRFGPRWLAKFISPSIEPLVHKWVITVSSWLKLSGFLLRVPHRDGVHRANHVVKRRFVVFAIAEGSIVSLHGSPSDTTDEENTNDERDDERFLLRIGLMLVLAALSMFLICITFMALPILVGRAFLQSISFFTLTFGLKYDDVCGFWIGFCILRGVYIIACFTYDHIVKGRTNLLFKHVLLCIRNVFLFSIWMSVIPGLLGLLIDLMIIIPIQVQLEESPEYNLFQVWLTGMVVLVIWIFLIMFTPISYFVSSAWREKLQRIRGVGINQLPFKWLILDVTGSTLNTLLITLIVPYVAANFLFPILGFSIVVNLTVQRFIWPAFLALIIVWCSGKHTRAIIIYLHRVEFNKRYKMGEKLVDFTEDVE